MAYSGPRRYREIARARVNPLSVTQNTRHYRDGQLLPPPASLEIVQVPPDPGYYLLYIWGDNGVEMTDTWHESLEGAMEQAQFEFGLLPGDWVR